MQKIDLSLVSKFVDASIPNDKRLALKLPKKIAEPHNCSLSFELDPFKTGAPIWLKRGERVTTQPMGPGAGQGLKPQGANYSSISMDCLLLPTGRPAFGAGFALLTPVFSRSPIGSFRVAFLMTRCSSEPLHAPRASLSLGVFLWPCNRRPLCRAVI